MKNETLEQFKRNQKRNQEILKKLLDFVHTGKNTVLILKILSKTKSIMRWKMFLVKNLKWL